MSATPVTVDIPQRLTFETAATHVTKNVPIAEPTAPVQQVREALTDRFYESASHLVVCRAGRFLGIVTLEDLLRASGESTVGSLMDREALSRQESTRNWLRGTQCATASRPLPWSTSRVVSLD
jgi:CBS domain-containing protein